MTQAMRIAQLTREGWTVRCLPGGWQAWHPAGKCKMRLIDGQAPWVTPELAWAALIAVLDGAKAKPKEKEKKQ